MSSRFNSLWRNADFMRFWIGDTISAFGTQLSSLALPLTAILVLGASPAQMAIIGIARLTPSLLLNLFAGVWIDRIRRRPVLIATNLGLALILGSIPVVALLNLLTIEYLYFVAFFSGILNVFFFVAYQAFLPSLVERSQLVEGNSKLETSNSVASILGPGLAGNLVQLITAPFAILVDAVSYLVSALLLSSIQASEPIPDSPVERKNIWREIGEGLRLVLHNKLLRSIACCTATGNFFSSVTFTVYSLYIIRELGITPAVLGFIFTVGGVGALLGASLAKRVATRFGVGAAIVGSAFCIGLGGLFAPLAGGPLIIAVPMLMLGQFITSVVLLIYQINQVSVRQAITPLKMQGRLSATTRFIALGVAPFGSLLGGISGETLGLRATLAVGAIGSLLAFLWVYLSPLPQLRDHPTPADELAAK